MNVKVKRAPLLQRNYIKSLHAYRFESLPALVLALYETHLKGTSELDEIYLLLDDIGYRNLKDIPSDEREAVSAYVQMMLPEWQHEKDAEKQTYLLLAAVQLNLVQVIIDEELIGDLQKEIYLYEESVISFIDARKIAAVSFTTI